MHTLTTAIELFEQEAVEIKLAYRASLYVSGEVDLYTIQQRDKQLERCLWAIEFLQASYVQSVRAARAPLLQPVAI